MRASEDVCRVTGRAAARVERTFTVEEAMAEARRCTASSPCLYCDVCQLLCPDLAITRDAGNGRIAIDLAYCKGCGLCAAFCPHGAIRMVLDE
ncbi:MAG: 4Fe-4S binding protein [Deltaproteobacteria bacterium]|nr:4Fe-4S binding protein [Deltaproteobacteria bacterium]